MQFEDLTQEQLDKARACTSAEELMALAQQEGIELSDQELESVSGGAWNCGDCTDYVCQVVCSSASKIVRPDLARKLM